MAARVADSLVYRSPLPHVFCEEVLKKTNEISADGEPMTRDHENHEIFKAEHDEQLLQWLNRYKKYHVYTLHASFPMPESVKSQCSSELAS